MIPPRYSDSDGYFGLHIGTVEDRLDPRGLGRVRVSIPGLFENPPFSPWAFPLGVLFGGAPQRGKFFPPVKTAAVGILFYLGNLDNPFYLPAHWGTGEVPTGAVVSGDDAGNYVEETKRWLIEIDDRSPEIVRVKDKTTGDKMEFNGTDRKLTAAVKDTSVILEGLSDKIKAVANATEVEIDGAADKVVIKAGTILLGATAFEKIILGDSFKAFLDAFITATYNAHVHPVIAIGSPTGPPAPLGTPMPASTLSSVSKTE